MHHLVQNHHEEQHLISESKTPEASEHFVYNEELLDTTCFDSIR